MTPKKRLNILLADDGSQHAQAAVELLLELPLPSKSSILILRAFNSGQIPSIPEFERSLERSKSQLVGRGFRVETELKLGSAAQMILEHAEVKKPDLIVLGAKGLRSTMSILLGGVAQQVMEYAPCPVLIVRAPCRGLQKILLATDGSPSSLSAARYLCKFPLPPKVQVHVMHVLPPAEVPLLMEPQFGTWHTIYTMVPTREEGHAAHARETKHGEALLARTCNLLRRNGIDPISKLARGDAATEIMDYVKSEQIDLIVAGSRGLSNLKGLWTGSVTRKLVHYSDCSVLLVKGPGKE
ncbi:MAG: universal stress protein [Chloroflexi bacterium]|nr:universal stress protein [Chloroflexota bacterium]